MRRNKQINLSDALDVLYQVSNQSRNGALLVDTDGFIIHFNESLAMFLGIDASAQIGRHVTEVVHDSRMHIVARTGRAEVNVSHLLGGRELLVQRIPIRQNGQVVAVFGHVLFRDVRGAGAEAAGTLPSRIKGGDFAARLCARHSFGDIVAQSDRSKALVREAVKSAATDLPILITGEPGTGKHMLAQAIHNGSARSAWPFLRLDCAAVSGDGLEPELFRHEAGGDDDRRPDKVTRGTLFLDRIEQTPPDMQAKLLRILDGLETLPKGHADRRGFRLVAAATADLAAQVERGQFRAELFFRLNVVSLTVPPLRHRVDDILPLARHLLEQATSRDGAGRRIRLSTQAGGILTASPWPGNVRELRHVIDQAVAQDEDGVISPVDLPFSLHRHLKPDARREPLLKEVVARAEKAAIRDVLKLTGHNKAQAAAILGIHRTLLYKKMQKYGLGL